MCKSRYKKIDVLLTRILREMLPTLPFFLRQSYRSLGSIATTRRRVNHNAVRSLDVDFWKLTSRRYLPESFYRDAGMAMRIYAPCDSHANFICGRNYDTLEHTCALLQRRYQSFPGT